MNAFPLSETSDLLILGTKGVVLLAVTGLATLLLRRASAAARHAVWFLGMAGLLLLPFAAMVAPRWVVEVPAPGWAGSLARAMETSAAHPASSSTRFSWNAPPPDGAGTPGLLPDTTIHRALASVFWLWLGGSAVLCFVLMTGVVALARLRRRSPLFLDGRIDTLTRELALAQGIDQHVPVLRGRANAMPMSWGLVRRVILLPAGAERWDDVHLQTVLRHELAHVRRRDCLTQAVAEFSLALNWLNPLAWLAVRRLRVEREHACDDAVVLGGVRPSDYARALIDLAANARPLQRHSRVAATMIRAVQLHDRLRAILDDGRARSVSRRGAGAAALLAVVLVGAVAGFTPAPGTTRSVQATAPREVVPTRYASSETDFAPSPASARVVPTETVVSRSTGAASRDRKPERIPETLREEVAARKPVIFVNPVPLPGRLLPSYIDPDRIQPIEVFSGPAPVQGLEPGGELGPPVTIHVENRNFHDATLWLLSRRGRVHLGAVTGKAGASFTAPVTIPADVWRVEIDLIGGEWCRTDPLSVDPGDVLDLLVAVDVSNMPGCYPAGERPEE
jgi:beta-lactamase regulating signal transducer with metallopeptidase domain